MFVLSPYLFPLKCAFSRLIPPDLRPGHFSSCTRCSIRPLDRLKTVLFLSPSCLFIYPGGPGLCSQPGQPENPAGAGAMGWISVLFPRLRARSSLRRPSRRNRAAPIDELRRCCFAERSFRVYEGLNAMAKKGILGRKLGMTQVFDDKNRVIPVTVIEAGLCRVVQLKTPERDGYTAVQIAFGAQKEQRLTKAELGHLKKANVESAGRLAELRVDDISSFEVGQVLKADVFDKGEKVDVTGISKGKGFAGGMKRHNFKGMSASHGTHRTHRAPGSIGACATPARVFKGTRMAGQMGNVKTTVQNLEVIDGDAERGLLLIKGAIPGPNGSVVLVRNSVKAGA